MRNILLKLAYDGTNFYGFQLQNDRRSVAGILRKALYELHGHEVAFHAAGRTDTGVHAIGQYVNLYSDKQALAIARFVPAINHFLPSDVRVCEAWQVPLSFHARYDAISREYCYHLYQGSVLPPVYRKTTTLLSFPIVGERVNAEAKELIGRHDFYTFSRVSMDISTVREVFLAEFRFSPPFVYFCIKASGFLRRMVRSLVGTLLEREKQRSRGRTPCNSMTELLRKKERRLAGTTAAAKGLWLVDVTYRATAKD